MGGGGEDLKLRGDISPQRPQKITDHRVRRYALHEANFTLPISKNFVSITPICKVILHNRSVCLHHTTAVHIYPILLLSYTILCGVEYSLMSQDGFSYKVLHHAVRRGWSLGVIV